MTISDSNGLSLHIVFIVPNTRFACSYDAAATATSGEVTPDPSNSYNPMQALKAVLPFPLGNPINASLNFLDPLLFNSYNS